MKTPITILTGYLGAGKTTLLKHILDTTNKKIAVIMNEFGEVDIDGAIIKGKNVDMKELAGGCVCCSLTGEFEEAIQEIIDTAKPEWIVVETTGVAEPDGMIIEIEDNLPQLRLDAIVTVVDCDALTKFPTIGHTGEIQIEMADILLLSKTDLISDQQKKDVLERVKEVNVDAPFIEMNKGVVDCELLFGINAKKDIEKHEHHHDHSVEFFAYETNKKIDLNLFKASIEYFPKELYRAKGIIQGRYATYVFNYVALRVDFSQFEPATMSKLVFIGEAIKKHEADIISLIKKCEM